MELKGIFADDNAVSPVIGVILMVAITVILAAVIGTFVLGLGDQVQNTSPSASFTFDYTEETSDTDGNHDSLSVTHDGGDKLVSDTVSFSANGIDDDTSSGDSGSLQSDSTWDDMGGTYPVTAGSSVTLDGTNTVHNDDDGSGDSAFSLDLSGATVRVVWSGESGDSTATLGKWEGPDS